VPEHDLTLPIDGNDIPGFVAWVSMNPFTGSELGQHDGHDFGAYLRDDGNVIVGLPEGTPVRSVASGRIIQYLCGGMMGGQYGALLNVEHLEEGSGVVSAYVHVISRAAVGANVGAGEKIAEIGAKNSSFDPLFHLHLTLREGWGVVSRYRNPSVIDPSIVAISTPDLGWTPICEMVIDGHTVPVKQENFPEIKVGNHIWRQY